MTRPFTVWSDRRREDREFEAEMADFYSKLPGDLQSQLRHRHEQEARTPGTLAYRNRLERTRPWRVLITMLLVTLGVILGILASGGNLTDFSKLFFG